MELYLHIGINKTASSFLQTVITKERKTLQSYGYYLPPSKWDKLMLKGVITPGNGHELAKRLLDSDVKLIKYLNLIYNKALEANCDKVLLSNEVLIRLFSSKELLTKFYRAINSVGFDNVNCLCFLRNIYDHSLSLFKHRSKRGKFHLYDEWFDNDYETLKLFHEFLEFYKDFSFNWKFNLYTNNGTDLLNMFYNQFLSVPAPVLDYDIRVNKSQTLNTLKILHLLYQLDPFLPKYYVRIFTGDDVELDQLKEEFFDVATDYFQSYSLTISKLALLLNENEEEHFTKRAEISVSHNVCKLKMSNDQYSSYINTLNYYIKNRYSLLFWRLSSKFKSKYLSIISKNKFDKKKFGGTLVR